MQWVEHDLGDVPSIQSYDEYGFEISGQYYDYPIIISPKAVFRLPENHISDLGFASFSSALAEGVGLIVLGTGKTQAFLSPQLQAELTQNGVGVACMNTAAACRTLGLLQSEGRAVWAWLWL